MLAIQKTVVLIAFVLFPLMLHVQETQTTDENNYTKLTDNEHFNVTISSKLKPLAINTMHAWIIHVENKDQQDVLEADITVNGGMPEHNHGLPTRPQVTKNLGEGCYLLEGMKFHMGGWWTLTISIVDGSVSDSVTFDINL